MQASQRACAIDERRNYRMSRAHEIMVTIIGMEGGTMLNMNPAVSTYRQTDKGCLPMFLIYHLFFPFATKKEVKITKRIYELTAFYLSITLFVYTIVRCFFCNMNVVRMALF